MTRGNANNGDEKICQVIEFSYPADINVSRKIEEKVVTYGPVIRNLQIYNFNYYSIVPP